MGKPIAIALVCAVVGYVAGAAAGGVLISLLSSNTHDRSVEAAMTGAFFTGPLAAVIAAVVGFMRSAPRR